MAKKLSAKQIAAIEIMSRPKMNGMTHEQIAQEVGVARSTLFEWKKQDAFTTELKREIVRKTSDRLPEVFDSIIDNIIETGNAAAFRTLLQTHGILTDKVEIETKDASGDMDAIRAEIERMRERRQSEDGE